MYMKSKLTLFASLLLVGLGAQAKVTTHIVTTYDTIMQVHDTIVNQLAAEQPDSLWQGASHRIFAGIGAGYGTLNYKTQGDWLTYTQPGHGAAMAEVNYAFFFNPHWGVSIGLGANYYQSTIQMHGERIYPNFIESDGEMCELTLKALSVKERQHLMNVAVPIMAQTEWMLSPKLGLYGAAGVSLQLPVLTTYDIYEGQFTRSGYYDKWHLLIDDVHDFGNSDQQVKGKQTAATLGLGVQAQIGCVIPITSAIDLGVGIYGSYVATSLHTNTDAHYFTDNGDFLPLEYAGFNSTSSAAAMNPWQAGIQVSVRWKKVVTPKPAPEVWEPVTYYDTTWVVVPRYDTIYEQTPDTVVIKAIQQVVETSIIWFYLDDATPKLDPIDMLDKLAQILIDNPEQEIEVNGHTCDIGKRDYNERLSLKRAEAVAQLLKQKGVLDRQIHIHAFANSQPFYSKSHDRVLDRRVEIIPIVKK